jgi:hypothetical protein
MLPLMTEALHYFIQAVFYAVISEEFESKIREAEYLIDKYEN